MPIPFILGGIAIIVSGTGIYKIGRSIVRNIEGQEVNQQAQSICDNSKEAFNRARESSYSALESLGRMKLAILDTSVNRFVNTFSQITGLDSQLDPDKMKELGKFKLDRQTLQEMQELASMSSSILKGIGTGSAAGALAAFGAFNVTTFFAAASTGTAIASLSGVAATNATLAFLGGGSLAAGGFGMAGGMIVLGGLVAAPALALLGVFMDAEASKNLDNAYCNLAKAREIAEECQVGITMCNGIKELAIMFSKLFQNLDKFFKPLIEQMENIVQLKGFDAELYTLDDCAVLAMAQSVASAISTGLKAAILDKDGRPEENAAGKTAKQLNEFIEVHTAKLQLSEG